jgi:DNA invertase Pin-like site-specific DNA recombinase
MTKVVIYARVSTQGQDFERQLVELRDYADKMNYEVVKEFSEKISGVKHIAEREALIQLLEFVRRHKIDKVLVYECSRLSRRAVDFLSIIETLTSMKISVFVLQNGLETLLPNGQENPLANMVLGILAHFNYVEKCVLKSRMVSGYNQYRAKGGKVGRKQGYRKTEEQMLQEYAKEIQLLKKGISLRNIQAITGTSPMTLQKIKKLIS